jgi:hypothetical protein
LLEWFFYCLLIFPRYSLSLWLSLGLATRIVKGQLARYGILCWVCGPCVAPGNQGADFQTGLVSGSFAIARGFQAQALGFKKLRKMFKVGE